MDYTKLNPVQAQIRLEAAHRRLSKKEHYLRHLREQMNQVEGEIEQLRERVQELMAALGEAEYPEPK